MRGERLAAESFEKRAARLQQRWEPISVKDWLPSQLKKEKQGFFIYRTCVKEGLLSPLHWIMPSEKSHSNNALSSWRWGNFVSILPLSASLCVPPVLNVSLVFSSLFNDVIDKIIDEDSEQPDRDLLLAPTMKFYVDMIPIMLYTLSRNFKLFQYCLVLYTKNSEFSKWITTLT